MLTRVATLVLVFGLTLTERAEAQTAKPTSEQKTSVATPQEPQDPLGRDTPRSAVMTFLKAIQKEDYERATEYLDSRLKLPERQELARKLGVILDRKLSARLNALSDKPDGNLDDGLRPNRDLLGVIPSDSGNVDVLLDRVQRGKDRPIWLFSSESLREVPRLYGELEETWVERYVPEPLRTRRLLSIPLYQWIEGLLGLPLILGLASILTRILSGLPSSALAPPHPRTGRSQTSQHRLAAALGGPGPSHLLDISLRRLAPGAQVLGVCCRHAGCYCRHVAAHASRRCDH